MPAAAGKSDPKRPHSYNLYSILAKSSHKGAYSHSWCGWQDRKMQGNSSPGNFPPRRRTDPTASFFSYLFYDPTKTLSTGSLSLTCIPRIQYPGTQASRAPNKTARLSGEKQAVFSLFGVDHIDGCTVYEIVSIRRIKAYG